MAHRNKSKLVDRNSPYGQDIQLRSQQAVEKMVADTIAHQNGDKRVFELAANAVGLAEWLTDEFTKGTTPRQKVACQPGCAWCCYQRVEVLAPEVFYVMAYLGLSDQLPLVESQIIDLDNVTRGMDATQRLRLRRPCALLIENKCAVYPTRPLLCRGQTAFDVGPCKALYDDADTTRRPTVDLVNFHVYQGAFGGLKFGAAHAGLHSETLEMTAALRIALYMYRGPARWLSGENVFAEAIVGHLRST
jgi:Putative zinc- or iron-chelating domain